MLLAVVSGFLLALAVPSLHRVAGRRTGLFVALLPAGLVIYTSPCLLNPSPGERSTCFHIPGCPAWGFACLFTWMV